MTMTECLAERSMDCSLEKDDLINFLHELQNRRDVLEKALSTWNERYSDIMNFEEELDMASFLTPFVQTPTEAKPTEGVNRRSKLVENSGMENMQLRRRTSTLVSSSDSDKDPETSTSSQRWCPTDRGLSADTTDDDNLDVIDLDDQYFEVTSVLDEKDQPNSDSDYAMQSLLERLRETKERVTAQNDEFEGMVSNISKAANESCLLRERVGMTHRSLTLIEMRQEKVMREALYENVTANCTIRRLHEEVIQLRIREAQHQGDIQRLMAENNRLKMKLMEARVHGSSTKRKSSRIASNITVTENKQEILVSADATGADVGGLHDIDELNKPVCVGAIQRGSLSLYKTKNKQGTICVSEESLVPIESTVRRRKTPCPLCSDLPTEDDLDSDEGKRTRSVGTSTADIENIIAPRTSIVVMGMILPIPLFISCLLRTIEESMLMLGRVCFAELPPFDPSFPELQEDVMAALSEMYQKVKRTIR